MTNQHGDFIWYELMTTDADAAQKFYEGLVGWTFKASGQSAMDYRHFSADGPEVGGLMGLTQEMQDGGAQPLWAGYIRVDNVDEAAEAVSKAGGQVLMPAWDIPGVGRLAFVTDPQGAPFYLMSDSSGQTSEAFAAYKPRRGHCAWNELVTDSPDGAKDFYREVFGWVKTDSMDMGDMGSYDMYRAGDYMLGAIIVCGLGYAEGGRLSRRLGGWQVICWALVISLLPMAILCLATLPNSWTDISPSAWMGLGYVSVFSMLIGFFFWYRGLALGGIAAVGQLQLLQPFFGLMLASLILAEPINSAMIAVTVGVVACVAGAKRFS